MQSVPTLAATSTIAVAAAGLNFASPPASRQHDELLRALISRSSITSRLTGSTRSSARRQPPVNGSNLARDPSPLPTQSSSFPPPNPQPRPATSHPTTSLLAPQHIGSQPRKPRRSLGSAFAFPSSQEHPLPRNRLVKRSASQRAPPIHPAARSDRRHSSFPRPATSHQRSVAEAQSSEPAEVAVDADGPKPSWSEHTHYFKPKVSEADYTVKMDSFGGSPFIRRIYPDQTHPTLVMGGIVRATHLEIDHALEGLIDGSTPWHSRPATPSLVLSYSSPVQSVSSAAPEDPEPRGRRSFSINHILRPSNDEKSPNLLRRKSRRIFSAPGGGKDRSKGRSVEVQSSDTPDEVPDGSITAPSPNALSSQPRSSPPTRPHTSTSRPSRPSTTPSEMNSSQLGSDAGTHVFSSSDEEDLDFRSDTNYDSVRTAFTKSTANASVPPLAALFNMPPDVPELPEWGDVASAHGIADSPGTIVPGGRKSNAEDESSTSTPVRTVVGQSQESSRIHSSPQLRPNAATTGSSVHPQALNLGRLAHHASLDDDDLDWSGDDEDWNTPLESPSRLNAPKKLAWADDGLTPSKPPHSPTRHGRSPYDPKSSLFDWAEQSTVANSGNTTPPRPRTVHGKKEPDLRGSRSTGRRAPSGHHARSQSVPVLADPASQRTSVTNKFGTWGLGSKGVTEDWDDDFDFEPSAAESAKFLPKSELSASTSGMQIPTSIRAAQDNVVANINLLREWGMLIEELKELRIKALNLDVPPGRHEGTLDEVDAMIDLADQEAEDEGISGIKARASPGQVWDDGFDELEDERVHSPHRVSMIVEDDVFTSPDASSSRPSPSAGRQAVPPPTRSRPRKDSEAVARSVIEELHRRRSAADPKLSRGPKMEFDTATLKHIVPYVNGLMRKVKEVLREAEGLHTSPVHPRRHADPPISQIFENAGQESPSAGRSRARHPRVDDGDVDDLGEVSGLRSVRRSACQ